MTKNVPLSLYIHTPWCVQKCPYCDFNSHTLKYDLPEKEYIDLLIQDLELDLIYIQNRPITSIFIGGGTPSLFSPQSIEYLLKEIRKKVNLPDETEITLEANPGTVEQKKFSDFLAAGINRLSVGIQSFDDQHLKKLGRIHGSLEAKKAIEAAINSGFKRINLDIMHGLPNQTTSEAIFDIETAIAFGTEHLSWYQLTLEENTPFFHHPPPLPSDEICWEIFQKGQKLLQENGYQQYEVSAYAKAEKFCQHNLNYWEFGDYLGIGAGACSKITNLENHEITRFLKKKHPKQYLQAESNFIAQKKLVLKDQIPLEFMMNALRLKKAIPIKLFEERTGLKIESIQEKLKMLEKKGWLSTDLKSIQLTGQGYLFLNDVISAFL